ncbi:MAG: molecular chaperone Hsp33 [Alphaproteobacteria bacterium]|nr:molecular chaperone Hsp33 [Alphaproteobacteria bacterium]
MIINTVAGNDNHSRFTDFFQPFLIDESNVKGNFIRLGQAMDVILSRHDYPDSVSRLLAEQAVLACMLSGNLDDGGSLTVQVKGAQQDDAIRGPVGFTVIDVKENGDIRGYADLAPDALTRIRELEKTQEEISLKDLIGEAGFLAITITPAADTQQYQGIVALSGDTLAQAVEEYFTQSEQLQVSIKVSVGKIAEGGKHKWYASGMMIQRVPDLGGKAEKVKLEDDGEDWNRSRILMNTVKNEELLNPTLSPQTLLVRLFNEDGVWVYEPKQLQVNCRCSRERIEDVLGNFPDEDIEEMKHDGVISVSCQFCNKTEVFRDDDIARIRQNAVE